MVLMVNMEKRKRNNQILYSCPRSSNVAQTQLDVMEIDAGSPISLRLYACGGSRESSLLG